MLVDSLGRAIYRADQQPCQNGPPAHGVGGQNLPARPPKHPALPRPVSCTGFQPVLRVSVFSEPVRSNQFRPVQSVHDSAFVPGFRGGSGGPEFWNFSFRSCLS